MSVLQKVIAAGGAMLMLQLLVAGIDAIHRYLDRKLAHGSLLRKIVFLWDNPH